MTIRALFTGWLGLLATGAFAQAPAPMTPAQVAERIDRYRFDSRSPGTYRALAGLGDPDYRIAYDDSSYNVPAPRRALLAAMLPDQEGMEREYWSPTEGRCRIDYALSVAEARIARLGRDHPYVRQWLRAQRAVFTHCQHEHWRTDRQPPSPLPLPPPLAIGDPAIAGLQRDDRAYQAASLLFYRGDAGAQRAFAAIARTASPHAPVARYMVAALHVSDREFYDWTREEAPTGDRDTRARRALADAQAILADPALASVHPLAQALIGFLGWHMRDAPTRAAHVDAVLDALETPIGRIEREPAKADRYARAATDVRDLHRLYDAPDWWLRGTAPADAPASRALAAEARTRPLAAFLLVPVPESERRPWGDERSGEGWHRIKEFVDRQAEREGGGEAWSLVRDSLDDFYRPEAWAGLDALVRAAQAEPTDRRLAAVAILFYHQARRALAANHAGPGEERDAAFHAALARVEAWPWRDGRHHRELLYDMLQYLVARGRIAEARLLRDRTDPRGQIWYGASAPILLLLAEDEDRLAAEIAAQPQRGQELLNLLSTGALARLAAREDLPRPIRARFARVAWTRLYALQRRIPLELDRLMRGLNPEITSAWTSRAGARRNSRALVLDVLRSPGLNILLAENQRELPVEPDLHRGNLGLTAIDTYEHSDNNWWCAWQPQRHELSAAGAMYDSFFAPDEERSWRRDPLPVAGAPAGLRPLLGASFLWRSRDLDELDALAAIPSAPQFLAERAIAWRGSGPRDGQDEALAFAVRATRYGCQRQGGHGRWSRAAHTLLHRRFPTSAAAGRTRWWFDCSHFSWGCQTGRDEDPDAWQRWAWRRYIGPQ